MTPAEARHVPVLGREAIKMLSPQAGGVYIDATFGAGGYSRAILDIAGTRLVGIDRDRTAIAGGFDLVEQSAGRLTLVEDRFSNLADVCAAQGFAAVDGVVMDVGVSSMQLDEAGRGFSFRLDGPLDMRMGQEGPSAADVVATATEAELADSDIHPATRTFQALRIFVNEELDELQSALAAAERVLKPGGRLAVVSFHSLEDRIVKNFLNARAKASGGSRHLPELAQAAPSFRLLTKRPATPGEEELAANPRARSAKLRAAERTEAPAHRAGDVPSWPRLADTMRGG